MKLINLKEILTEDPEKRLRVHVVPSIIVPGAE
jgi:hypothetical protein